MTVYVDDCRIPYRQLLLCHMLADDEVALHDVAARIGIKREYHEGPPDHTSHYNIAQTKRALAVKAGAVEITRRQAAAMVRRRDVTGSLGHPDDALRWYREYRQQERSAQVTCVSTSV